jgi:hypothetical protein
MIYLIASIVFTSKYTQKIEYNSKTWRVFSTCLVSLGLMIESSNMLYPQYFLFIATLANMSKYQYNST